ncbi:enterotoxin [Virgibacillus dokdonensis]|uniref:Enterotoxin n=1 Tax=Virgibacillus dokdonensis TaxID=302167 RepID=A0A3E0WXB8_9BACI|nr:HBL/NHE enterotoxin family protein [Virgibacillus dokdonensis]RFA36567.1 enterotoxin [Virgibacillus dokdonensis]
MSKRNVKPILLSLMATTILFNTTAPSVHAKSIVKQEPIQVNESSPYVNLKQKPVLANKNNKHENYDLGPNGIKEAIEKTGSNALVMDLYALTVLKQPDINFKDINIISEDLSKNILSNQTTARENAKEWLDKLKPQLISTNQNIINYDNKFSGYYDRLLEAAENKDAKAIASRVSRLSNNVSENKEAVDKLIVDLKKFREKLQLDTQNLKANNDELTSILASQDAGIPLLQKQIDAYYEAISKYNDTLIASSVATALGPLTIAGGTVVLLTGSGTPLGIGLIATGVGLSGGGITGVVLAKKGIDDAQEEIINLTGKVSDAQIQLAGVTTIKKQMEHLTQTIDLAINSLQNISTQWSTMDAKYKNLLNNISVMDAEDFDLLKEDLSIAKKSWGNIKTFAEKLYVEDTKVVDND